MGPKKKKKRRKPKQAALPDKTEEFILNVLAGTASGLIVLAVDLIIGWLAKK